MARPRVIRTEDGGEITLKNVSSDMADRIKNCVEKNNVESVPVDASMSETAIGLCKLENKWVVVEVAYNPSTKEASVAKTTITGTDRDIAIERLKIEVANHLI